MACEAITNYLATESSRLGPWFYHKHMVAQSPWPQLVPRGEYPRGIGHDFRTFTAERALPTSILSWTSANAFSDGENCGACASTFNSVDVGHTTRTTTLQKIEFKSRMFCVEDLKPAWESIQQLQAIRKELGNYVTEVWNQRYQLDTFAWCKYKVVADGTIDGNYSSTIASDYPAECATDVLQQALLDYWYFRLVRDGAASGAIGGSVATPILPLLCSYEASKALLRQNDADRQDLRYAKPGELIVNLSATRVFQNFAHITIPFPRRFNCVAGAYTQVSPFTSEAKTTLTGGELNPSYLNAPYEEAIIFNRNLWRQLVPRPMTSAAGATFSADTYTGEYKWLNDVNKDDNVWGSYGQWFARLWAAAQGVSPELGVAIVYRRCNEDMEALPSTCVYS